MEIKIHAEVVDIFDPMIQNIQNHIKQLILPLLSDLFSYDISNSIKNSIIDKVQTKLNEIVETVPLFKEKSYNQLEIRLFARDQEILQQMQQLNDIEAQNTHLTVLVQTYDEQVTIFQTDIRQLQNRIKKLLMIKKENKKNTSLIGSIYQPDKLSAPIQEYQILSRLPNQVINELDSDSVINESKEFEDDANNNNNPELLQYYMDKCQKLEESKNKQLCITSTQTFGSLLHKHCQTETQHDIKILQSIIYELTKIELPGISKQGDEDISKIIQDLAPVLPELPIAQVEIMKAPSAKDIFIKPKMDKNVSKVKLVSKKSSQNLDQKHYKIKDKLDKIHSQKSKAPIPQPDKFDQLNDSFTQLKCVSIDISTLNLNEEDKNNIINIDNYKVEEAIQTEIKAQQTDFSLLNIDLNEIININDLGYTINEIQTIINQNKETDPNNQTKIIQSQKVYKKINQQPTIDLNQQLIKDNIEISSNKCSQEVVQVKNPRNKSQSAIIQNLVQLNSIQKTDTQTSQQKNVLNVQQDVLITQELQGTNDNKNIKIDKCHIVQSQVLTDSQKLIQMQDQLKMHQSKIIQKQIKNIYQNIVYQENGIIYPKLTQKHLTKHELYVIQNDIQPCNKNEKYCQVFSCDCLKIPQFLELVNDLRTELTYTNGVLNQYDIIYKQQTHIQNNNKIRYFSSSQLSTVTTEYSKINIDYTQLDIITSTLTGQKQTIKAQTLLTPQHFQQRCISSQCSGLRTPFEVRQIQLSSQQISKDVASKIKNSRSPIHKSLK
ncbi:hypothetical protein SS50377_21103 [Spironucleus salmonicida]|uniref:Uncharacterized protein n=2 Tax=Spironucleus TaxID=39709 RepID=V6LH52_9EUKA|nr:hypothetical protein [Spironucleus barkhanus]KAH0577749.1 hypothetical protein SS50377_21103 [Spironucleus salmonicida]|eukprot:EST43885.1 Hypothetical protein SS50377_16185 [Spironucleus salmonicida]